MGEDLRSENFRTKRHDTSTSFLDSLDSGTFEFRFLVARFFSFYVISVSFTLLVFLPFFFFPPFLSFFASILYPFILQTSLVCKSLSFKQCRSMYSSEPRPSLFFRLISFYFTALPLCNRTLSFIFYEVNIFLKHSTPRSFLCVSLFHARFAFWVITLESRVFVSTALPISCSTFNNTSMTIQFFLRLEVKERFKRFI